MSAIKEKGAFEGAVAGHYGCGASVLVIAEGAGRPAWETAIAQAGCRLLDFVSTGEGAARLDELVASDSIVLDLAEADPTAIEPLVERIAAGAEAGRFGAVVAAPIGLVDHIAGRLFQPGVELICEPDVWERAAAIRLAAVRRPPRLSDVNKGATARLQQLSEEVGRIASVLAALSEDEAAATAVAAAGAPEGKAERIEVTFVRSIIRARRLRDHFFKSELFADPAWDMLLDLMAARIEKQRVAVSSLCIASAVPPTTALRWIKTLCDQGLFVRIADPEDGRRVFIELSDETAASLEAYLRAAQRVSSLIA